MDKYNGKKKARDWLGCEVEIAKDFKLSTLTGFENPLIVKQGTIYEVVGVSSSGGLNLELKGCTNLMNDLRYLWCVSYSNVIELKP